ncbi:MAG TPA: extracellular solute-binding protein [Acidimicrobiales bacterium]|nr:extracellular solute-binding protein [Acidimicrobiales bacterium]
MPEHRKGRTRRAERRTRASRRSSSALALAAILLGASAGLTTLAAASGSPAGASTSNGKVPLVLYAAEGYDAAMAKAFQKATGIPVNLDDDSTGPLLTKVQAEKNNPKWSLLWVDGDSAFANLDTEHILLRGWEPKVAWNSQGAAVLPKDRSYVPTGLTMAGTLVYNSTTVSQPPTSWSQLLQPQWDHQVGMNDPSISGPTYPFVAGMMSDVGGPKQGEAYFTKLQANGLDVHETNGDTLQALEIGQIKLAIIQSSAGIGASLKDPNIKVAFLNPVTPIPSVIGIDAKASPEVKAEAKRFVEFVLSSKGQEVMKTGDPHGDSLFWPVLQGVSPLPALPALSSIPAKPINPYLWGARESTINAWFTNNIA